MVVSKSGMFSQYLQLFRLHGAPGHTRSELRRKLSLSHPQNSGSTSSSLTSDLQRQTAWKHGPCRIRAGAKTGDIQSSQAAAGLFFPPPEMEIFKGEMGFDDASGLHSGPQDVLLCWLVICRPDAV